MARRWECQVCGYIHEGEEPPESCPVCGADRSQFAPLEEVSAALPGAAREGAVARFLPELHLHPILVHFPNGLMPTAWLFLGFYALTGRASFEEGAFWLVAVVCAVAPLALATGVYSWRKRFGGKRAPIFMQKLGLATALLLFGAAALTLRAGFSGAGVRAGYLFCLAAMLACVVLLGYLGGKLVFARPVAQD